MKRENKNDTRYCPICGEKLVRNGHYDNGKIRLYCTHCKKSYSFNLKSRKTIKENTWKNNYCKYITGKLSIKDYGWSKTTYWRNTRNIKMDDSKFYQSPPNLKCIGLDGTWTGNACYLIANARVCNSSKDFPIAVSKTTYEKFDTWMQFINKLPNSEYIVCDGQKGLIKAITLLRPKTKVQICIFHVWQRIKTKLSLHPKTDCGKELLEIGKFLFKKIKDTPYCSAKELSEIWIEWLNNWFEKYKDFIYEKTYSENGKWFRTHKNIWSAYRTLKKYLDMGMLFTFTNKPNIPRTNNGLEGGINSQIKSLMWLHRGSNYLTRNNLVILYLDSRSRKYNGFNQ